MRRMSNLERRIRSLEAQAFDDSFLVPGSEAWCDYWKRRFQAYLAGEDPDVIFPVEAVRMIMASVESTAGQDPFTPPSTKARAADSVLDHPAKAIELEHPKARLTALERTVETAKGTRPS